jgi:transcriptional regulator with XRE-family HTH domain
MAKRTEARQNKGVAELRKKMDKLGLSSRALAMQLGISNTAVDSWLHGRSLPGLASALALRDLVGVSPDLWAKELKS